MKRNISTLLIVLLFTTAWSCNKPLPNYSNLPFDYSVTGVDDTTVPANSYITLAPSITLLSGDAGANPVTLTYSGMPANVGLSKNGFSFKLNTYLSDSLGARDAAQGV